MILTKEQEQAIENGKAVPIHVGGAECIVVRKDIYDRVTSILYADGDLAADEAAQLGWESGKAIGWETPEMAQYDDYDAHRTNP